jgi:hypothetical protein
MTSRSCEACADPVTATAAAALLLMRLRLQALERQQAGLLIHLRPGMAHDEAGQGGAGESAHVETTEAAQDEPS